MKEKVLFFLFFIFYFSFSQDTIKKEMEESVEKSSSSHSYRTLNSIPPYGLSKVEKIISKLESVDQTEDNEKENNKNNKSISEQDFKKLTVKEKFTYTMIHPEHIIQYPAEGVEVLDEENKIFGNLQPISNDAKWSERQLAFLKQDKKEIVELIKDCSLKDKQLGLNFKIALKEINSVASIPFLIDFYTTNNKKDKDILTLLMILIKKNKYYPFTRSNIYRMLYSDDDKSDDASYIDYSEVNEEYIIKSANNFYLQFPKKNR